jgi:hypothetical protein
MNRPVFHLKQAKFYICTSQETHVSVLEIILRPVFYFKRDVSENGFWLLVNDNSSESNEPMAVTRQRSVNYNRRMLLSTRYATIQ